MEANGAPKAASTAASRLPEGSTDSAPAAAGATIQGPPARGGALGADSDRPFRSAGGGGTQQQVPTVVPAFEIDQPQSHWAQRLNAVEDKYASHRPKFSCR